MGNAITQDARAIWLMLVSDGNWWTGSALTHYWRPTFALTEVQDHLNALAASGFIAKRKSLCAVEYAFTSDCNQLPGGLAAPTLLVTTGA